MTHQYTSTPTSGRRGSIFLSKNALQNICLVAIVAFTTILLVRRDVNGQDVNKYIFVIMALAGCVILPLDKFIYLMCFFFPLYVGLPGNYITLIFLAKFIPSLPRLRLKPAPLLGLTGVCMFMFLQNMLLGRTGMVEIMTIPGFILIYLLFSNIVKVDAKYLTLFFAIGTAAVGLIMLFATLNEFEMSDLLDLSTRLGADDTDYTDEMVMNVSIDPNYFGMFALTTLSTAVPLLMMKSIDKLSKTLLLIAIIPCVAVALIGLSRTFLLVLIAWLVLFLLSQRNFKSLILTVFLIIIGVILIRTLLPDVMRTLLARFRDADMATGNNRTEIIRRFLPMWIENIGSLLFGIGLFACNAHCMPLQYLFGGGIVFSTLALLFVFSLFNGSERRHNFYEYLPMLTVVVLSFTLPMANLLNFMFPIVLVGLYIKHLNKES